MEFLIVTGLSGSGKSTTMHTLEDIGFYCIDNIPLALLPKFFDLCMISGTGFPRMAVVVDIRGGDDFRELSEAIDRLKGQEQDCKVLFMDCDNNALINRYKETRRKHPLADRFNGSINDAVSFERKALGAIRAVSDYIIDSSKLSPSQLRERICSTFLDDYSDALRIHCISFGFKNGIPPEADLVFDVRCLPNPFYIPHLKKKTGMDKEVNSYVMDNDMAKGFIKRVLDFLDYVIPLYVKEGKSQLMIAVGCTGGQHRSVAVAQSVGNHLLSEGKNVSISHRDVVRE